MKFNSYYYTNRGGRRENEDSAGSCEKGGEGIYVVADGLGGHMFGKQASNCAVITMLDSWERNCAGKAGDKAQLLRGCVSAANDNILSLQQESRSNMKSTVVALWLSGEEAHWANTGDSRLYHVSGGRLAGVTEDHSVAYKKYQAGEITRAQIATDEDQSSLLRALGNSSRWEPGLYSAKPRSGDGFMLCSDGMWEYLSDEEVLVDCLKAKNSQDWAEMLLVRVLGRIMPGNDNLTVLTVKVE